VGIVLFVVADAVLIAMALRHTRDGAENAPPFTPAAIAPTTHSASSTPTSMTPQPTAPTPSSVSSARRTAAATATPTTTERSTTTSPEASDASDAAPTIPNLASTVLLDMASDGSAIRATRGSCPAEGAAEDAAEGQAKDPASDASATPPTVQVSDDAGETWTVVDTQVTAVQRVAAGRAGKSWFVAANDDCTLVEHDSAGDGKGWSTSSPEGAWALPVDATAHSILAPGGDVEIGCAPVSLAAIDSKNAVVACTDGAMRVTTDSGKLWSDGAKVHGVVGISFVGPNSGFALAVSEGCPAQVWHTADGGGSFEKLACLDGTAPQAITAAGPTILAQVDGAMQRSDDEGDTWTQLR
jgi:hypothetical protein